MLAVTQDAAVVVRRHLRLCGEHGKRGPLLGGSDQQLHHEPVHGDGGSKGLEVRQSTLALAPYTVTDSLGALSVDTWTGRTG